MSQREMHGERMCARQLAIQAAGRLRSELRSLREMTGLTFSRNVGCHVSACRGLFASSFCSRNGGVWAQDRGLLPALFSEAEGDTSHQTRL